MVILTLTALESRRQVRKNYKNVKILKFRDYIWNHHEKCIQMSTNMPSIGLVIAEICFEIDEI